MSFAAGVNVAGAVPDVELVQHSHGSNATGDETGPKHDYETPTVNLE